VKKLVAGSLTTLLAAGLAGTAAPAAASEPTEAYASASCDSLSAWAAGFPEGTVATVIVDGQVVEESPVVGELWTWHGFDWTTPHDWSVVLDAPDDAFDWSDAGTTTPCTSDPNVVTTVSSWCGTLDVWSQGYPEGTRLTVEVSGNLLDDVTFSGHLGRSYTTEPVPGVEYLVTVDAVDDALDTVRAGTIEGCDTPWEPVDPQPVTAQCDSIWVWLSDPAVYGEGSTVELVVDGTVVERSPFAEWVSLSHPLDHLEPHAWSVTITDPDGTPTTYEGVTTPCGVEKLVQVSEQCDALQVDVHDVVAAGAATVEVTVDGAVVAGDTLDQHGAFSAFVRLDQQVPHAWQVTYDAADDRRDGVREGVTMPCPTDGVVVYPEDPATVTACGATPADVASPASTEAITYTVAPDGILVTANPGHVLGTTLSVPGGAWYERIDDGTALVPLYTVLRPECPIASASVTGVCVDGEPFVDVVATQPAGASPEGLEIDWTGNDAGHEVVYGSGGFGVPFTSRSPWPGFVVHDDGTVSPAYDTGWRLEDIDVHLSTTVWQPDGSYYTWYHAMVEAAPVADPCAAAEQPTRPGDVRQGPGNGWGRPTYPDHPGQGLARGLERGENAVVADLTT
jgi:hypothetical protein